MKASQARELSNILDTRDTDPGRKILGIDHDLSQLSSCIQKLRELADSYDGNDYLIGKNLEHINKWWKSLNQEMADLGDSINKINEGWSK